ncbi:MAG: hypothetical protein ABEJ43_00620 [Haloferacaceae archaeon]
MYRRALLGTLAGGLASLAGCDAVTPSDDSRPGRSERSETPASSASLPYEGPSPRRLLDAPRGIRLRNATGAAQFVTLALGHGDRGVFLDSREVSPATVVRYDGLVRRVTDYRLVAETAAGVRHERTWRPTGMTGGLLVTLDDGVTSRVLTTCAETCRPDGPAAERTLYLDNGADTATKVRVRLGPSRSPDRNLSVRVPGLGRAAVPVPEWSPDYPLRIAYGDREVRREWRTSDGEALFVSVDGPPRVRCSNTVRELVVVNRVDRERAVGLVVDADGIRAVERSISVPAASRRTFANAVPPAGQYAFEVTTEDGVDSSFETAICPAAGPLLVIVDDQEVVVTVRGERRETVVDGRA